MAWVSFLGCDRAIFLLVGILTSNKLAHHFEVMSLALLLQALPCIKREIDFLARLQTLQLYHSAALKL